MGVARSLVAVAPAAVADVQRRDLRILADLYLQVQAVRVRTGEQLRAVLQHRDGAITRMRAHLVDDRLRAIRDGADPGPVPELAWVHVQSWDAERRTLRSMSARIRLHPAWPWLATVRGVGPALSTRLLGRLDVTCAASPASFWAYCGLDTVPAVEYACPSCGLRVSLPPGSAAPVRHRRLEGGEQCNSGLVAAGTTTRCAPRRTRGKRLAHDPEARRTCYLIGVSMLRCASPYAGAYGDARRRLTRDRAGWSAQRIHLAALRAMQKRFLRDLWIEWRTAIGLGTARAFR